MYIRIIFDLSYSHLLTFPSHMSPLQSHFFATEDNAICEGYERDEELYKSYNTEVFDCLFRSIVSANITVL
jgi:hypothetical protein